MIRILILQPEVTAEQRLKSLFESNGFAVEVVGNPDNLADADLTDVGALVADAAAAEGPLAAGTLQDLAIPFVLLAQQPTVQAAVAALKRGASDYLAAPYEDASLLAAVTTLTREETVDPLAGSLLMIGESAPMQTLFNSISKIAPTDSTVLIRGETGTGKELVARALHAASSRRQAPMIALNCATIPGNLIEAELFGHGGSVTEQNSRVNRHGLLEAANGGTLFLDELGELPLPAQARLLKVLQQDETPASADSAATDVRLITASHRDLEKMITNEQFREDLYYRLNVVSLAVPPLRERDNDVHLLGEAILQKTLQRLSKPVRKFSTEALKAMRAYPWPGNVRELENAIERAVILSEATELTSELLAIDTNPVPTVEQSTPQPDLTMEDYFVSFVTAHQDQLTETELAERLGISRKSLWERRQRLNIPRKKTRNRRPRRNVS